jgi:hypothetical protein
MRKQTWRKKIPLRTAGLKKKNWGRISTVIFFRLNGRALSI